MRLIVVLAAALAGVVIGDLTRLAMPSLMLASALALMATALTWRRSRRACTVSLIAAAAALGAVRSALPALPGPAPPQFAVARQSAEAGIHAYLPEPQASLAAGVLLGGSGNLDSATRAALRRSGLAHLVAIDGFKQVVVAASVGMLASRLVGARLALVPTLAVIAAYTLLTGAHPSAVRAGLMVGLASVAAATGRVADPLTSLMLATTAMAGIDPRVLLDLGLQLSLSATLGIVLLWPELRRRLQRVPRFVAEPLGLTLAVTVGGMPVLLTVFQQISLVSPLAHVLAVPLLPSVLIGAGLLALLGSAPVVGLGAAWLAWLPTTLLLAIVRVCGSLPGAALSTGRIPPLAALALAGVLLAWGVWHLPELTRQRRTWTRWRLEHAAFVRPIVFSGVCLLTTAFLAINRPDGRIHREPLAVTGGDATFVRGPTGQTELIVSGRPDGAALASQVADHLALWEHKLDQVVALDAASERALRLTLERYPADRLIRATSGPTTSAARPGSAD